MKPQVTQINPPFPSPPADDSITRLQYLIINSMNTVVDSVHYLSSTATKPKATNEKTDNVEVEDECESTIQAERLSTLLQLAHAEMKLLPSSNLDPKEKNKQIIDLCNKNEESLKELRKTVDFAEKLYNLLYKDEISAEYKYK